MSAGPDEEDLPPRAEAWDAAVWLALGVAVLAGSLAMDRLEEQDVPPFAAPGLLPGLLGIGLVLLGLLLLVRSLRRLRDGVGGTAPRLLGPAPGRALGVIGLCVLFGVGLVGHGLPFWAAATLFVVASILFLRRGPLGAWDVGPRAIGMAVLVGLGAGLGITAVFQELFLVRLP